MLHIGHDERANCCRGGACSGVEHSSWVLEDGEPNTCSTNRGAIPPRGMGRLRRPCDKCKGNAEHRVWLRTVLSEVSFPHEII